MAIEFLGGVAGIDRFAFVGGVPAGTDAPDVPHRAPWTVSRRDNILLPNTAPGAPVFGARVSDGTSRVLRAIVLGKLERWGSPNFASVIAAGSSAYLDTGPRLIRPSLFGARCCEVSVWAWHSPSGFGAEFEAEVAASPPRAAQIVSGIPFGVDGTLPLDHRLGNDVTHITVCTHYIGAAINIVAPPTSAATDTIGHFAWEQAVCLVCDVQR